MAIAFDTSVSSGAATSTSPLTFSHTCTGSNLILFVGTLGPVSSTDDITSMTYNGAAMTKVTSIQAPSDRLNGLWYLIAPATGAHNIIITFTGTFMQGMSASYTGVRQSVQPEAFNATSTASNTALSASVTTLSNNAWLAGSFSEAQNSTFSNGSNTTIRQSLAAAGHAIADSNAAQTPQGSYSLGFSNSGPSGALSAIVASMAPLGAALPTNGNFLAFM